ncbi:MULTISPECIES: hypothetical protein [unclassified Streptomyces]|uniref:hypothetical protein n=1 Tax=Streptomyces TaxID=1883 RepID=UPI000F743B62|nr:MULTISPECIES: hypothetical protein [unclassified Streptomyces]MBT1092443.1 hypothetical protein [Streptomyces sp. Tu102]
MRARRVSSLVGATAAARLLLTFGDYDRRLTLDAAEALRLAPLVEAWWRRGASNAEVRAAVTWGAPCSMRSAYDHIEARLAGGRPDGPVSGRRARGGPSVRSQGATGRR